MSKALLIIVSSLLFVSKVNGQVNSTYKWTWIGGDVGAYNPGVYGQRGVESPINKPGARAYFYSWMDRNGNFWIFGGQGMAARGQGNLNDLWRYNVSNGLWAWMAGDSLPNKPAVQSGLGVEATGNTPSARESGTFWSSGDGVELYLFGGYSPGLGWVFYNDVWAYNIVTNKWRQVKAWMVDSAGNCTSQVYGNADEFTPGVWPLCRLGATAANDGVKAYVFGGSSPGSILADFLMFSDYNQYFPRSNEWASVVPFTALPLVSPAGQYQGDYPYPGGRDVANSFVYNHQFYVFGGSGYGALVNNVSPRGHLNDLWRYDGRNMSTKRAEWTWLGGDSTVNSAGNYGTKGVGSLSTKPAARGHAMLKSAGGSQFILFGGGNSIGWFNDVWSYDAKNNIWTWLSGSPVINNGGNYGNKGIQSAANMIPARAGTAMWITSSGDAYVFGGETPIGKKNDMWKFSPQEIPDPPNDDPCNAIPLILDAAPAYGNNTYATSVNDIAVPCYGATNTVWYKYTPSASGFVQFNLGAGTSGDTLNSWLGVFVASANNCPSSITLTDSTSTTLGGCRSYYATGNKNPTVWSSYLLSGKTYYFRISGLFGDVGNYSFSIQSTAFSNIASGDWHDPAIWSTNKVPTVQSDVVISFPVTVSADAVCGSLTLQNGAQVNLLGNTVLTVLKPAGATALPGAALKLDGINDYVIIPHSSLLKPSTGITIEAWINPTDIHTTVFSEIYRKEDGDSRQLFSFQNNGTILSFGLGVAGVYSELDVPVDHTDYENQWVHVAATFDGKTKKIYRNNVLIGVQNVTGAISTFGTAPAIIGSLSGISEFFKGSIDEFRLWDHAIQIENKLNCEMSAPESGLLIYYKFNQGIAAGVNTAVNTAFDSSANKINGTLRNFTLSGANSNWIAPGAIQTGFFCAHGN